MKASWHFRSWHDGDDLINPLAAEQFDDAGEGWKPGESLVRECIQNSLDAKVDGDGPVEVHFRLSEEDALTVDRAKFWFGELWPHLQSKECELSQLDDAPSATSFLVVEDFGTKGLEGDVHQGRPSDSENRFFNFFRAEGLTGNAKDAQTGGSWGVGKSVFNRCSAINSFLALSSRRIDGTSILFGKSTLRWHRIGDKCFWYEGKFGVQDPARPNFVLPIERGELLDAFCRDFAIRRGADSSGLSIAMPIRHGSVDAEDLIEIVIREYFFPIVSGALVVKIRDGYRGRGEIRVDAGTIHDLAAQHLSKEFCDLVELGRWSIEADRVPDLEVRIDANAVAEWGRTAVIAREQATPLVERFEALERLIIRIHVNVFPLRSEARPATFDLYLQQAPPDQTGHKPVFVRNWTVVPNVKRRALHNRKVLSIIRIPSGPLGAMLKAAEPPSHTEWSESTTNFESRYDKKRGKAVIQFVVQSVKAVIDALAGANQEIDRTSWAAFFPIPGESRSEPTRRRDPVKPSMKSVFDIEKFGKNGVRIRRRDGTNQFVKFLRIRAAYNGAGGIRAHVKEDFDLAAMDSSQSVNCRVIERAFNTLRVQVLSPAEFELIVVGFDEKRDLEIEAVLDNAGGGR